MINSSVKQDSQGFHFSRV